MLDLSTIFLSPLVFGEFVYICGTMNGKILKAHLSLLAAAVMWGLMAPANKVIMQAGMPPFVMVNIRMIGAAILFWITSLFFKPEKISRHDLMLAFFAGMLCLVCNQGCFTFGLSLTSPVDASIMTTIMPIFTLILAGVILHEPITTLKVFGVGLGTVGAIILIMSNAGGASVGNGSVLGDIICLIAQVCMAAYLTFFKGVISRYHVVTLMKWMYTFSAIIFLPISFRDFSGTDFSSFSTTVWLQVGYVVLFGTYIAYMLMMVGQKSLRPTVVSMYNYIQPIVGSSVSVIVGIALFGWVKGLATVLIFAGVYIVTQSKSRAEMKSNPTTEK